MFDHFESSSTLVSKAENLHQVVTDLSYCIDRNESDWYTGQVK